METRRAKESVRGSDWKTNSGRRRKRAARDEGSRERCVVYPHQPLSDSVMSGPGHRPGRQIHPPQKKTKREHYGAYKGRRGSSLQHGDDVVACPPIGVAVDAHNLLRLNVPQKPDCGYNTCFSYI